MDWGNERWVKLYVRSEPDFLALSWQARGLFRLLLTEVDPLGMIKLGKSGERAIAVAVRATWSDIEPYVRELLADGCIVLCDGSVTGRDGSVTGRDEPGKILVIPNYVEAQDAKKSDRLRQAERREKVKATLSHGVTNQSRGVTPESRDVTGPSHDVTCGHTESHAVASLSREREEREELRSDPPKAPPEGEAGTKPKKRSRAKNNAHVRIPADFVPSKACVDLANTLGRDIDAVVDRMRDWAESKAILRADWQATLRTILKRAADKNECPLSAPGGTERKPLIPQHEPVELPPEMTPEEIRASAEAASQVSLDF